jgi:TolA-binding protein
MREEEIPLATQIENLETQLRDANARCTQLRETLRQQEVGVHRLEGALAFARGLVIRNGAPPEGGRT